jgi:hypothetical protein
MHRNSRKEIYWLFCSVIQDAKYLSAAEHNTTDVFSPIKTVFIAHLIELSGDLILKGRPGAVGEC